jgi:hypothetical protein
MPNFVYIVVRAIIVAGLNGKGLAQTVALLAVESVMLVVTAVTRPFERRSGNVINIAILCVRVVSVAILLVFVEELSVDETTKSVSGVVLVALQSALTGVLALLVVWNAIIALVKENPHRRRRKEMEKRRDGVVETENDDYDDDSYNNDNKWNGFWRRGRRRDSHDSDDALTPLDARNSLLGTAMMMRAATLPLPPPGVTGSMDSLVHHAAPVDGYDWNGYRYSVYGEQAGGEQTPALRTY